MIETAVIWSIQWWENIREVGGVAESWAERNYGWNEDYWASNGFLHEPIHRSQSYAHISSVSWKDSWKDPH